MSSYPPLVSVYLATRNRAALLPRAVRSVLAQDYPSWELLVVDDGSEDDTARTLAALAAGDARIRVLRHEVPRGAPVARNFAIREARGELVTGLDDDDWMRPERLRTLVAAWRDEHAFVCSAYYAEAGRRIVHGRAARIGSEPLLYRNCVGNQVLTRTERLRAVGGFDESFAAWQDYDLWMRLIERYGPALRLAAPSYVVGSPAGRSTITSSPAACLGARQFYDRYASRMTTAQRRSQRLLQHAAAGERIGLREALACWAWPTQAALLRYLVCGPTDGGG